MIVAPVAAEAIVSLRATLARLNRLPGMADPNNSLVPFGNMPALHVARFVVLEDRTLVDRASLGLPSDDLPIYLAFLGDCDGPADALLAELVRIASEGLTRIFAHCADFGSGGDLLTWLRAHSVTPAASYVNWVGRSVAQIREEAALHLALINAAATLSQADRDRAPSQLRARLIVAVRAAGKAPPPRANPPLTWRLREWLHFAFVALIVLLALLPALIYLPIFLLQLRAHERADAEIVPRPDPDHLRALSAIEDHDVTNQFSAFGSAKPGPFRLAIMRVMLWLLNASNRHIYMTGRLARVGTIHFARWVFLDNRRRLLFASNYDGSLDSYMDDFINKVAFGLNLVFSNGIGYPRTSFLVLGGASREQQFKNYIRRHQLVTEVWYKAYPGFTAAELARNTLLRDGFDRPHMTDDQARRWLALI